MQQGKYETALPILKTLSAQGGDYREWDFLSLSAAAKESKEARQDLVEHVKESFASGDLTEAQKIDRVYALLNAGEKARASIARRRAQGRLALPSRRQRGVLFRVTHTLVQCVTQSFDTRQRSGATGVLLSRSR